MAKLEGWRPKTRAERKRLHERTPPHHVDAEEWFSYTTFNVATNLTTRGKLLARFYEWADTTGGMKPWLAMVLNPHAAKGVPVLRQQWYWMHRQDFYAVCEQSYYGASSVHRVRLFYKQASGGVLWLASSQLGPVRFFAQEAVALAYYETLEQKKWHMAAHELDKVVAM